MTLKERITKSEIYHKLRIKLSKTKFLSDGKPITYLRHIHDLKELLKEPAAVMEFFNYTTGYTIIHNKESNPFYSVAWKDWNIYTLKECDITHWRIIKE